MKTFSIPLFVLLTVWLGSLCVLLSLPSHAQMTVTRPRYTAVVDTQGSLASLKVGGTELLQTPIALCPGVSWTVTKKENETDNATLAITHYTLHSAKGDGRIDYRFTPETVSVTLTHTLGGYQSWELIASPDVVAIENLQNSAVSGAEAIQYREHGAIQATPIAGMSRAQRTRLYLRNGGKVLFWHDGWGAPFNLDEMGTFRDFTYHRNLLEDKKPMLLRFEIETPSAQPLQPAPAFLPQSNVLANLFEDAQPIHFDLVLTAQTQARLHIASHWKINWSVRDYYDRPAGTGAATFATADVLKSANPGTPVVASLELPRSAIKGRGWFSVVFALTPVEKISPAVAPSEFQTRFGLVAHVADFGSNALPTQTPSDYQMVALLGLKCLRESRTMREYFPEKGKFNWQPLDEVINRAATESKKYDVTWFFQANERPAWCSNADYEQIAFEMVSRYKDRCHTWEVENEPNFHYSPADYVTKALVPFAKGAKRADPNCVILGPACVSVPNSIAFLKEIAAQDALKYLDGVSTHTYMGPGEPWELFGNWGYLQELSRIAGRKPLWQTEQGYTWSHVSKQEQARYIVRQYLNAYATNAFTEGIINRRQYYFYPVHNGFEPWYVIEGGLRGGNAGTPEPAAVALRVMNEQTAGRQIGMGAPPQTEFCSIPFEGATDDVIALWTLDFPYELMLDGEIRKAVDIMGNTLSLKRVGKHTLVPVSGDPIYLTVPHGVRLRQVTDLGSNYASVLAGATATASSETKDHPASHAIDGFWGFRDAAPNVTQRTYWEAATVGASPENPVWLQIDLPQPRLLEQAELIAPLPAVDGGTPRDFAIQVSDDAKKWHTVVSVKDWADWIALLRFKPVKTQHVRFLITRLNDGWHLDGKWMFMVNADFKRYTSMQCRLLDVKLYGPGGQATSKKSTVRTTFQRGSATH